MSALTVSRLLLPVLPLVNFGPIPGGKLTFAHLISLGLFITWAVRDKLKLGHPSFLFALAFLLLVATNVLVGIVGHSNPAQLTQLVNYGFMMMVMLVAYTLAMRADAEPRLLLDRYFSIGVAYAAISLALYVYGIFNGAFLYQVTDLFNIANTFDRGGLMVEFTDSALPRVTGLSPEPSFWSVYLCTVLAVGVSLGRRMRDWGMMLVALVVGLTLARTGLVVIAVMLLYQLYRRSPLLLLWAAGLSVVALLLFIDFDAYTADSSITQRFGSLVDGWQAFANSPLLGLGWGGFREYAQANRLDYPLIFNYYLQVAAEAGIIGLCLLCLFLASLVVHSPRDSRIVLISIFVAWFSAPAYNLAYAWFLFGVLLAAQRRSTVAVWPAASGLVRT